MKEYVLCKDEKARTKLLAKIKAIGVKWCSGAEIGDYKDDLLSIGYNSYRPGITCDWDETCGTRVPAWMFLGHLTREFKKHRENFHK